MLAPVRPALPEVLRRAHPQVGDADRRRPPCGELRRALHPRSNAGGTRPGTARAARPGGDGMSATDATGVQRKPIDRAEWSRAIRGQLGPRRTTDYAVARTLADYGNKDGTSCRAGIRRLAADCECSEPTVKRVMARLVAGGWFTLTARGRRKLGEANTYRTTVPVSKRSTAESEPGCRDHQGSLQVVGGEISRDHEGISRDHEGQFVGITGDTPPGKYLPGVKDDHSDSSGISVTLPRDDAGDDLEDDGRDEDEELLDSIISEAEEKLGHMIHPTTSAAADSMVCQGAHRKAIMNTILKREREQAEPPEPSAASSLPVLKIILPTNVGDLPEDRAISVLVRSAYQAVTALGCRVSDETKARLHTEAGSMLAWGATGGDFVTDWQARVSSIASRDLAKAS